MTRVFTGCCFHGLRYIMQNEIYIEVDVEIAIGHAIAHTAHNDPEEGACKPLISPLQAPSLAAPCKPLISPL